MTKTDKAKLHFVVLVVCALFARSAFAQSYPAKTVRVVVPWPPGGVTDVLTRALAQAMSESTGQQFVVEGDVPSHAISASLYAKLPYDVLGDFEPVAMIAGSPMVLVTNPALGVRSLREFIGHAKGRSLSYGSSGNGAITHLAIERLKQMAGLDLVHVPYKGTVPAIASVLAGDTALAFGTIPGVVPHAKAGKLVLLGSSFGARFAQIPEVPPVADTLPGFDMGFYTGLFAPGKTPAEIVGKLASEVRKAHAQPKVREVFAASAAEPGTMTPAELKRYMATEVKSWGEIVRTVGLKVD